MNYPEWLTYPPEGDVAREEKYREGHYNRVSMRYVVDQISKWIAFQSILDVGAGPNTVLDRVPENYTVKNAVDTIRSPKFIPPDVTFWHEDFLDMTIGPHDVVVALEVLEHIRPDQRRDFAQKLLLVTKHRLIVSIPYMWENTDHKGGHPHDGYNETNIRDWFWPVCPDETHITGSHWIGIYIKEMS